MSMIEIRPRGIFSLAPFGEAYRELFELRQQDEVSKKIVQGPLTYILNNYTIKTAKGGSNPPYSSWSDQTYFTHVINGLVISGKMLESRLASSSKEDQIALARLFFAGHILHDSNKLFDERDLKEAIDKHWHEIVHIIGPYMAPLGGPENWSEDIKYLILSTEEKTRNQANLLKTHRDRTELEIVADYSKLADKIGSIRTIDSRGIYHAIKKTINEVEGKNQVEIQHISLNSISQTMIRLAIGRALSDYLFEKGRLLCHLPDGVIYLGESLTIDDLKRIIEMTELGAPTEDYDLKEYLGRYPPSGNALRFSFAKRIDITPEVIDKYIKIHNKKIVLWSGKEWRKRHLNLPHIMTLNGVRVELVGDENDPRFELAWAEDESRNKRSQLVCARRIFIQLDEDNDYSREDEWLRSKELIDGSEDALQLKTLRSFAYAILTPEEELETRYQSLLNYITELLEKEYRDKIIIKPEELLDIIMPSNALNNINDVPDKTTVCLQCGEGGEFPLEDVHCFGTKATSGTGKKITSLKENPRYKGRLCKLCLIENDLRRETFPDLIPKRKPSTEPICLQIHMGDYIVPIDVSKFLNDYLNKEDVSINVEKRVITVGGGKYKREYKIDYHAPTYVNKPKNKEEEFFFLKNTLKLISSTGFKVKITPLYTSDEIFKPTFLWENAPQWVRALEIDNLRLNQINDAQKELKVIETAASLRKGSKDLPLVITSVTRHPRGLFFIIYRFLINNKKRLSSSAIECVEWYMNKNSEVLNTMRMSEIVEAACDIVYDKPKSNNDHTWMINTALETFERNANASVEDRIQRAAGRLWDYAKRQNKNSDERVQTACMNFAVRLNELLQSEFPEGFPSSDAKKDLIAQFAIMYNIAKWKKE